MMTCSLDIGKGQTPQIILMRMEGLTHGLRPDAKKIMISMAKSKSIPMDGACEKFPACKILEETWVCVDLIEFDHENRTWRSHHAHDDGEGRIFKL